MLSRPEIWFDCLFERTFVDSASPPFAEASPPSELACAPSPTASEGPLVPPDAVPPLPPVVVVTCVLEAVLVWWHWFAPAVLPVASWLQTAELLPPFTPFELGSPPLSRPEIAFDWSFPRMFFDSASPPFA